MVELDAGSPAGTGPGNPAGMPPGAAPAELAPPGGPVFGGLKPQTGTRTLGPPRVPITWAPRDELVRVAIKYGLNAREISLLTLSCPQPLTTSQGVYDLIQSRGWERLYNSAQARHRRRDFHDRQLNVLWTKLVGQALEYGHPVDEFLRDAAPVEGLKFRPDLGLRIADRSFYVELQLSKLEFTRWTAKMRHYVKLYRLLRRPFRVLFVIAKQSNVAKARYY